MARIFDPMYRDLYDYGSQEREEEMPTVKRIAEVPIRGDKEFVMPEDGVWEAVFYKLNFEKNLPPIRPGEGKRSQTVAHLQLEWGAGEVDVEGIKKPLSVRAFDSKDTKISVATEMLGVSKPSELIGKPIRVAVKRVKRKSGEGEYAKVVTYYKSKTPWKLEGISEDKVGCFEVDFDNDTNDDGVPF